MKVNLSEQQIKELLAFLEYQRHEDPQFFYENVRESYEVLEREALQQGITKPYVVYIKDSQAAIDNGKPVKLFWSRDCAQKYKQVHESSRLKLEVRYE